MSEPANISVERLLAAVIAVPGVRDARIHSGAAGDHTLRVDFADGVDEQVVGQRVARVLEQERDAQSVASGGLHRRRASDVEELFSAGPRRRVQLDHVRAGTSHLTREIEVSLVIDGVSTVGKATGPASENAAMRTAAAATLEAVEQLLDGRAKASADFAGVCEVGTERTVLVLLTLTMAGHDERLVGAALVHDDFHQAAARATLDALNRRLVALLTTSDVRGEVASKTALVPIVMEPSPYASPNSLYSDQSATLSSAAAGSYESEGQARRRASGRHALDRSERTGAFELPEGPGGWQYRQLPAPRNELDVRFTDSEWAVPRDGALES